MITTSNLSHQYPNQTTLDFPTFTIDKQAQALIVGASGCGKTTLLHLLAGFLKVTAGKVVVNNVDYSTLSNTAVDKFRAQTIGYVPQQPLFVKSLTVREQLLLVGQFTQQKQAKDKADELLEKLGLSLHANKSVALLSGGEQQRLSIAMALMNEPELILADEPTSSLDDTNCENVLALLKEYAAEVSATLVVVTHDNRLRPHFDKIIEL